VNAKLTASLFGCTQEQATAQMRKNLVGLEKMADKALATGRKVNGYTHDDLVSMIAKVKKGWNL
jgi:hypothetical protein